MSALIPSHRDRPTDDPIFALHREALARKAKGEHVVNATVGVLLDDAGALSVLPTAAKTLRETPSDEWAAYAPIAGTPEYLEAVKRDVVGTVPTLAQAATAVATPGGSGALHHAIKNFLEPGQAILTSKFYWSPYATLATEADRRVETFEMFDAQGAFCVSALRAAAARQLDSQGRVLLFLNDPCHNPTGYTLTAEDWDGVCAALSELSSKGPITLVLDWAYAAYDVRDPRGMLPKLVPLLGKVQLAFAWSASKTFTHYGLRVGALIVCEPDEAERTKLSAALSFSCRGTWSNCNRGGLSIIGRLLCDPALRTACDAERNGFKKELVGRAEAFNALARPKGFRYPNYEAGFFVTVFTDDAPRKAARMREDGVFVVAQEGALRIALCATATADIARLVAALEQAGA